jgi:MFS family permease
MREQTSRRKRRAGLRWRLHPDGARDVSAVKLLDAPPPREPRGRRGWRLPSCFEEPSYRRLWASGFCVNVARWMDLVMLGWLALELTGSPFMVGVAAFARSAPLMVLGPFGGIIADRVPRGRVLLVSQAMGAVTALALAVIFASGAASYGRLVALEVVFGALWALDFPARRTSLYTILGSQRVAQAVSLETVSTQLAKMIGPLAAGVCLARVGPAVGFTMLAGVYATGVVVSARLRTKLGGPGTLAPASIVASLAAGLEAAWTRPTVRAVLLATVAMNVLFFPYQHMLPVFARHVLAVGPAGLGALVAADGFGALLGALAIASPYGGLLTHRTLFAGAIVVSPVLLTLMSGLSWLPACLVLLVAMGAAESSFAAMQSTIVLLSAPEDTRGGTMGILSACIGTQPLGTLAIGLLAGSIGVSAAFTTNALVALLIIVPLAAALVRVRSG